jgi:small subunit ribosomal protein S7
MSTSKSRRTKISPDPIYNSLLVTLMFSHILKSGKKSIAQTIVYKSFKIIKTTTGKSPIVMFERAVKNVTPRFTLKLRKTRARVKQVPTELRSYRGVNLSLKWIAKAANKRSGRSMADNLAQEIIAAAKCRGASFQEKVKLHKKVCSLGYKRFSHLRTRGGGKKRALKRSPGRTRY